MRRLIILFVFCWASLGFSQEIKLKDSFWGGPKFIQYGKEQPLGYAGDNLKKAMVSSKEAVHEVNNYGKFFMISHLLKVVTAFCLGQVLNTYFREEKIDKGLLIGSVASIAVDININGASKSSLNNGVKIYNESLKDTTAKKEPSKE